MMWWITIGVLVVLVVVLAVEIWSVVAPLLHQCPECGLEMMRLRGGSWKCLECGCVVSGSSRRRSELAKNQKNEKGVCRGR